MTGYDVNSAAISPTPTSASASQVVWNASGGTSQFQLTGTVADMVPGEVRHLSTGTTVTATVGTTASPPVYNAAADFTLAGNPNGVWTYGWTTTLGGAFQVDTDTIHNTTFGIDAWVSNQSVDRNPGVGPNYTGSDVQPGGIVYPADQLLQHPGSAGQDSVVRWTAPADGIVSLKAVFTGADSSRGTTTDVHVRPNGVSLFDGSVVGFGNTASFTPTQSIVVDAGDAIDFVVGYLNGDFSNDSTATDLTVTLTPDSDPQLTVTLTLPPVTVAAVHIIRLVEATQSADRDGQAAYALELTNPFATDQTFDLAADGFDGLATDLPASVIVGAGPTVAVPVHVAVPANIPDGTRGFRITATTAGGVADSVEGERTVSPVVALASRAVHLTLNPTPATAGQGTPATFTVRVTNVGDATDTYTLSAASLPADVSVSFSQTTVTVPAGLGNFRDVTLTLTPQPGATAGRVPFTVTARSTADSSVAAAAAGTLDVTANGVRVTLTATADAPGNTFQMTVTNTGSVPDTYDLALADPASLVADLAAVSVALAPGESRTVPITTRPAGFALAAPLQLTAVATSRGNPAVRGAAAASLTVPPTAGLAANFDTPTQALPAPGDATFLLIVHNTGNAEDAFTATVTGTTGSASASLAGLDGAATQTIPTFRLPGGWGPRPSSSTSTLPHAGRGPHRSRSGRRPTRRSPRRPRPPSPFRRRRVRPRGPHRRRSERPSPSPGPGPTRTRPPCR